MDYIIKAIGDTLNGNTDAYGIIVREYAQRLYKYALSVCRNQADAEDIVQETLIAGYLQLSSLREPEKIENWLLRILKNKAFNYIARTKQSVSLDEICETVLENESPESCFIEKESLAEWQKRINLLSPALRETALLYFWHRLPMNDIANCLGVSLGTVKRRIHDAREKLRKEHYMSEKVHTLSEAFVTELTERIKKLENIIKKLLRCRDECTTHSLQAWKYVVYYIHKNRFGK